MLVTQKTISQFLGDHNCVVEPVEPVEYIIDFSIYSCKNVAAGFEL